MYTTIGVVAGGHSIIFWAVGKFSENIFLVYLRLKDPNLR